MDDVKKRFLITSLDDWEPGNNNNNNNKKLST